MLYLLYQIVGSLLQLFDSNEAVHINMDSFVKIQSLSLFWYNAVVECDTELDSKVELPCTIDFLVEFYSEIVVQFDPKVHIDAVIWLLHRILYYRLKWQT